MNEAEVGRAIQMFGFGSSSGAAAVRSKSSRKMERASGMVRLRGSRLQLFGRYQRGVALGGARGHGGHKIKSIFVLAALLLLLLPATRAAAETSRLAFVTEYVRELGVNENMRALAEHDMAEAGADKNAAIIRSSTRIVLELSTQVSMLKGMTLDAPFDTLPASIAKFYEYKIQTHNQMIEIATALASGPKPGVDYGAMVAEAPKLTAMIEYLDRSLFQTTPLIFGVLIADKPDKQGHMSRLLITRAERNKLVQSLQLEFGKQLDVSDQNYIVSSAAILRDYLTKKGFKCSDDAL
jgi:hypothetical protein